MAIDTRNKRASALLPGLPWRGFLPAPDSAVDAGDRLQGAFLYRGIAADAPVAVTFPGTEFTAPRHTAHFTVRRSAAQFTAPPQQAAFTGRGDN